MAFYFAEESQHWIARADWSALAHTIETLPDMEVIGVATKGPEQDAAYMRYAQPHLELLTHERKITLASIVFDS